MSSSPVEVLVVDDDVGTLSAVEAALSRLDCKVVRAPTGGAALRYLLEADVTLILLDVQLPDMDGFEVARMVRSRRRSEHIPIIFVTAYSREDADVRRAYGLGAVDFLFKPVVLETLVAKVSVFVDLAHRTREVQDQAERLRAFELREERRRLLEERRRWETEQLRGESRRKDLFLAMLAHELRNPLAPLVTGLELMELIGLADEQLEGTRRSMARQVRHLTRLVDDLLDISRISTGKINLEIEPVDLRPIIAQAVESVRAELDERGHALTVDSADEPLFVSGDPVRLTQVVVNLLSNAARYTDPGGAIRISTTRDGEQAIVRVADNGRGIDPAVADRIFDMFMQAEAGGQGLGLGLTLVNRIVELHGGAIEVRSDGPGRGAEFVVRLPGCEPVAVAAERSSPPPTAESEPSLRILVADDDPDIRETIAILLEQWGHRVKLAKDGVEAVEQALAQPFDVALVDLGMPRLDGYGVARRLRAELGAAAPRLIAMTGFGTSRDRARTREAGFDRHLTKPADARQLKAALRSEPHAADHDPPAPAVEGQQQQPPASQRSAPS
jgi:signal transduction histidine kinase